MRAIKFRAWDKSIEEMVKPEHLAIVAGEPAYLCVGESPSYFKSNDLILMQWTGLKDKNGVEIYEGDILNHKFYSRPVKVQFVDGCFEAEDVSILSGSIEVIGNIYENPELIK